MAESSQLSGKGRSWGKGSSHGAEDAALISLIRRAKGGDVSAFQQIYDRYAQRVLNFIYRMIGSLADAEDLTQDTFVSAFEKLNDLRDDSKFEAWLFIIARNYVYQRYRLKAFQAVSLESAAEDAGAEVERLEAPGRTPEGELLKEELERVVQEVIGALPEKYREVFVLSAIERLSYQQIAQMVGRSLASVKTDIHRARLIVREMIKRYLKEGRK